MTIAVKAAAAMLLINAAMMLIFVWVVRAIGPVFASQTANVIVLAGVFWGWIYLRRDPEPLGLGRDLRDGGRRGAGHPAPRRADQEVV